MGKTGGTVRDRDREKHKKGREEEYFYVGIWEKARKDSKEMMEEGPN